MRSKFKRTNTTLLLSVLALLTLLLSGCGAHVYHQVRKGDTLYFLASGSAKVEKDGKTLSVITPGYSIGEMAYVRNEVQTRSASVISLTEIDLIEIEPEDIEEASDRLQSAIQALLLRILAERLEQTSTITAQYL